MQANILIEDFGKSVGIEDLALSTNFSCSFVEENDFINIQYQPNDEMFMFHSVVVPDIVTYDKGTLL